MLYKRFSYLPDIEIIQAISLEFLLQSNNNDPNSIMFASNTVMEWIIGPWKVSLITHFAYSFELSCFTVSQKH
jgi:hypothetical protein